MQYFTEQAGSQGEAIRRIKDKYGESARILTHRTVRLPGFLGIFSKEGVEVTGYISEDSGVKQQKKLDLEEEKKKILATVKTEQTMQQVLKEVQELKEKLDSVPLTRDRRENHPTVEKIRDLLIRNDFIYDCIEGTIDRIREEFSLQDLDDYDRVQDSVIEWLGDSIGLYEEKIESSPKVMILVGPTGVGKTTTIAKLAAVYGIGSPELRPLNVRMITIDNYRIGARQQIETYGSIMGIPVSTAETFDDLRKTIALYQRDVDLVLIDTIGKSPKDYVKLAEMKELLTAAGTQAEAHLAVSATTKASDLREIMQQFEPINYLSVVITKLDETARIGNIVSVLAEKRKPVSYVTDGQRVPQDIQRASALPLLLRLEGFRVNRQKLEERFPAGSPMKIEWDRRPRNGA
jgi:flagellar biosynthesis protein FlhF